MNRKLLVLPAVVGLIAPAARRLRWFERRQWGERRHHRRGHDRHDHGDQGRARPARPGGRLRHRRVERAAATPSRRCWATRARRTQPVPDAARKCEFTDKIGETYRCQLQDGLQFSNGDALTVGRREVLHRPDDRTSTTRTAPAPLLADVDHVETPDATTVVFHLKTPDATFPFKLATPAAAIVDRRVYPAKKPTHGFRTVRLRAVHPDLLEGRRQGGLHQEPALQGRLQAPQRPGSSCGSTRTRTRWRRPCEAGAHRRDEPHHDAGRRSPSCRTASGEASTSSRRRAPRSATWSSTPTDPSVKHEGGPQGHRPDRRPAGAGPATSTHAPREPLYSMVPQGITGHTNSFFNLYGDPSVSAAQNDPAARPASPRRSR